MLPLAIFCLSVAISYTDLMPFFVRMIYGLLAVDIALDFIIFNFIRCIQAHGGFIFSYNCFISSLQRKVGNTRPIAIMNLISRLNTLSVDEKNRLLLSSLLGPSVAKRKSPILRAFLGGVPSLIRGGKVPFLRHHLSNPISIDHFGLMLVSIIMMAFTLAVLTGYGGVELKAIHINFAGEVVVLPSMVTYLLSTILFLVSAVFLWNFMIYLMYLRLLHWIHWINVFLRKKGAYK